MIPPGERKKLLSLVGGDDEFIEQLFEEGLLARRRRHLLPDDLEVARLAHTLVHDLDVNWAGVEIILRMRHEIISTRRQVAELFELARGRRHR